MAINTPRDFFALESASGIVLVVAAVVALLIANSPLASLYDSFLESEADDRGRRPRDRQAVAAVDQRRVDGGVLLSDRTRSEARSARRRTARTVADRAAGLRRARRVRRSRGDLRVHQLERSGRARRLGDSGRHRHRVRARRAVDARQPRAGVAQAVPDVARDLRRHRRDHRHRAVLRARVCRSCRCRSRLSASPC